MFDPAKEQSREYILLAAGFSGQWLEVGNCPQCKMEYPAAALEWRYSFARAGGLDTEIPF
jgi:hypothetical protein